MTMEHLIVLVFGLLLLLVTLGLALSFLSGPMALLRKTGVFQGVRWVVRTFWRGLAGGVRILVRGRRARVRRPPSRPVVRQFR